MSRGAAWGALATAAVLAFGTAGASSATDGCLPVVGGGALTVEGVGRVVFAELVTDRVRDAATFGGRVCLALEGSDVVFLTEELEVVGIGGPATLEATGVSVQVPGWTLEAASLRGGSTSVELREVSIVGADAIGRADAMRLEFATGVLEADGLRLVTPSIRLDAASASLDGDVLVAEGARVSSCDCAPDVAPVRVDAVRVRLDLAPNATAFVEGGTVVAAGVRWPLPNPIALDEAALADLVLPVAIGPDPDEDGAWRVALLARAVAPGVRLGSTFSSRSDDRAARAGFDLAAEADGVAVAWTGASDRLAIDVRAGATLSEGWRVDARQRFEAGAIRDPVRDVAVRLRRVASGAAGAGRWSGELGALAAATGQTLDGVEVADLRGGAFGALSFTAAAGPVVPGLDVAAAATRYPGSDATQAWASLRPHVEVRTGDVRIDAEHLARWVAGGSPFGARVDRVAAIQRSDAVVWWGADVGDGARVNVGVSLRYRWDADPTRVGRPLGFEDLTVRLGARLPVDAATVALDVDVALAGSIDPRPDREAFASVRLAWTRDRLEAGVRTSVGLAPGGGWRDVTVFAAVPFDASPAWSWRPYLAVDLLAFAGGPGPWLRGHGLDLTWRTCCGTVEVGYRSDAYDGATTHFAVALPVRPLDPDRLVVPPGSR